MNRNRIRSVLADNFSLKKDLNVDNIVEIFIEQYYYYVVQYIELENSIPIRSAEQLLDDKQYSEMTKRYMDWLETKGEGLFSNVLDHLDHRRLNDKVRSFYEYYSFMLEEAMEQRDADLLLDHLYRIPSVMKEEFERFGFLVQRSSFSGDYLENFANDYKFHTTLKGSESEIPFLV